MQKSEGENEVKWTIFLNWCQSGAVDFRYLFQDRKLQPSTIGGYRSATLDKLENSPIVVG